MKTKKRFLSILLSLALALGLIPGMSLTAYAATTVEITESDFPQSGNSFTKDGVTVTANTIDIYHRALTGGGSFSTNLGNFTKIEVATDYCNASGTGWSSTGGHTQTWNGTPASSVSFSGDFIGNDSSITIKCTIAPAAVPVTSVTLNPTTATLTAGGDAVALTATISPSDATDKTVKWSVGSGFVVLYSDADCTSQITTDTAISNLTVYAKGSVKGSETILVKSNADVNQWAKCEVTVAPTATISPAGAGTVAFTAEGSDLKFTATANSDYLFDHWSWSKGGTVKTSTSNPGTWAYYLGQENDFTDLTAHFKRTLTPVTITPADKEVTWSADGIAIPVEGMFTITEGAGTAAYSVENGTGEGTFAEGKLTVTKCGTFTVKVSTAATSTHAAGAETSATLTVNKANAVVATVTANNRTYDGTEKPLVTVTGTPTGGTIQYALGTATEATEQYTTSIPAKTDAGT